MIPNAWSSRRFRVAALVVLAWLAVPAAVAAETAAGSGTATKAEVPVETFTLDNGMQFLLVHKPELTTVSAGWVAHVGSANERPGITGLSHLFEHMMFKGTHTIGTQDHERDLEIIAAQEELQEQVRRVLEEQRERWRLGEIEDPFDPDQRTEELVQLEKRFQELVDEQRALMVKDEFDKIYTKEGASGMNAGTTQDLTLYFITVPANKLELWFWMESDRLQNPVFREFYSERDVVHEERRLRTESTPTGKFDEQFDAMFWQSHPYAWPVVGWPSDLRVISKEQADRYYDTYYAPNNLTGAIVGNFDPARVKQLAERYFGRLERGAVEPPDVVTLEMPQLAEKRMIAHCDCQPQVEVRYHTVPFMHGDSYALDVLAGLLNGRTGRLYKSLILDQQIASSAFSSQNSQKYAGYFTLHGETKGEAAPERIEQALYEELQRIREEPIPEQELQKVKNNIAADAFRQLDSPFFLMLQLLWYDGLGDWGYMNTWADKTLAVTAEDVKRVSGKYFEPGNRAVALYYRKAGAEAESWPEGLSELAPEQQEMVKAQIRQLRGIEDPAEVRQALERLRTQKEQVPPEFADALGVIERWLIERAGELERPAGAPAEQQGGA